MIESKKDIDFTRLIKFLEQTGQQEALNTLSKYNWLSSQYDIRQGTIEIKFYKDRSARASKIISITVDPKIDRYVLWQYFCQPELRDDWED